MTARAHSGDPRRSEGRRGEYFVTKPFQGDEVHHGFLDALAAQRRSADAITAYQKAITLGLDTPATQIALGAAYAQAGDQPQARAVLERLQSSTDYVSPGELAILLAALGERDQAFASLERGYAAHDIHLRYLGVSAGFDPLRSDPRFQDLLRRVGLAH